MLAARALAAREVDLGQLAAPWPEPPQNRQRLLSRRCLRSSAISQPSLPNLLDMSGFLERRRTKTEQMTCLVVLGADEDDDALGLELDCEDAGCVEDAL